MLKVRFTTKFKKDLRKAKKQAVYDEKILTSVIDTLMRGEPLDEKYLDHELVGKGYAGSRECHLKPDWLLVYKIEKDILELLLLRLGSHSELF
ncbi:MAG: type II toxin-antitoxin system YafQ family toxin [Lachnospiraceae bacterium]|nr:type II toxin-antitoxin system YafQ family toxin [Lachnospiraceae bacterium]